MDQPINMLRMQVSMDLSLSRSGAISTVPSIESSVARMTDLFGDGLSQRTIRQEVGLAFEKAHLDALGHPWSGRNYTVIDSRIVELPGYGFKHEIGSLTS